MDRPTDRRMQSLIEVLFAPKNHSLDHAFKSFSVEMTKVAILKSSNSLALGPDGLMLLHLKFLEPLGLAFLTKLFNLSLARADIPVIWKRENIIPIPKPGKPAGSSTSVRPISLLSLCMKILERLLVSYITEALSSALSQHGYRQMHSTTTALLPIVTKIAMGLNEDKPASRTTFVTLDISKAFDAIDHVLLIEKVSNSALDSNVVKWLSAYLCGHTAVCMFQGPVSKELICHD
jgi:hypothetical protein